MENIELLVQEVKKNKDTRKAKGQRYRLYYLLSVIFGVDDYVEFLPIYHLMVNRPYKNKEKQS